MKKYIVICVVLGMAVLGCSPAPRYTSTPGPPETSLPGSVSWVQKGIASYYADKFHGRKTANGEVFNMHAMTAAHRALPFNSRVRVTNLDNGKTVIVRINDRGPFVKGRIIDLSYGAARVIGMIGPGTAQVRLEVLEMGDG
jgi:rare lipoprotein A